MSSIHTNGMDWVVLDGINNMYRFRVGIETTDDDTTAGYNTLCSTQGSNPQVLDPSAVTIVGRSGSVVESVPTPTWESNTDQGLEQFKTRVERTSASGVRDWAIWNGFTETFNNGADATISNWDIEAQRNGIAKCLINGLNNQTVDVYLLDGVEARYTEAWAQKTNVGMGGDNTGIFVQNDLTYTNNTGGSRTVGGIEAFVSAGGTIIFVNHADVTLNDGDAITYTTVKVNFSGLT